MRQQRVSLLVCSFLFAAGLALAALPASAATCESLKNLSFNDGTVITLAQSYPAGRVQPDPNSSATFQVPAFCRVAGVVPEAIRFEVWLPDPSAWNAKFQGEGNGGLAGTISYSAMATALNRNYATASTDTGHQVTNPDGDWALGHDNLIVDFAYRGTHEMTVKGQAITAAYYGKNANLSYFVGCSKGGQQALMEAQRYPDDYDGIIAGDPANFWTHHYLGGHLYNALAILRDTTLAHYISPQKLPAIRDAVNAQCDALDGVADGVLNDPRQCHFDSSVLLCKGAETDSCLTQPQLDALNAIYAGPPHDIYPGLVPGDETGWRSWTTGSDAQHPGSHLGLGIPFFKYFIFDDPNWDFHTLDLDTPPNNPHGDVYKTDHKLVAGVPMQDVINAVDPNLRPLRNHGAKMIHYHGFSDPDITPINSINYYESVTKEMAKGAGGPANGLKITQDFYRLFMVPGMEHCAGGPGATSFDMVTALEQWVEHGTAPASIPAAHLVNGAPTFTRPLCPYPQKATYVGGDNTKATSFVCK